MGEVPIGEILALTMFVAMLFGVLIGYPVAFTLAGIGAPLIFAIQSRQWSRVSIILLGIIIVVALIDAATGWLRKKLL